MAARAPQDSIMDESDECCPLCIEEFDISDRSFRPCPCGYQVCQFCYNNIKSNLSGLCPACRRPYDDKNVQWKMISPEEIKADVAAQARKKAAARRQEAEKRQAETQNRKHLAGIRVLQKNLVYIVGMTIPGTDEDVLRQLRSEEGGFGQYGPIIKVVISKTKEGAPLGIYVTFVHKEDAATCIKCLDGQTYAGRMLKAQYGTTKYCSAFLRNETCNNRNCMFLHEPGDENQSFSREDLSSFNALSSQRQDPGNKQDIPLPPAPQQQPTPGSQHAPSAPSNNGKADEMSRSDSGEGSALPTTASWARNPQVDQNKRSAVATNRSTPSPRTSQTRTTMSRPQSRAAQAPSTFEKEQTAEPKLHSAQPRQPASQDPATAHSMQALDQIKAIVLNNLKFRWEFDRSKFSDSELAAIDRMPLLIDPIGGKRRLARLEQQEREKATQQEHAKSGEDHAVMTSGSLQLGGEPDTGDGLSETASRRLPGRQTRPNTVSSASGQQTSSADWGLMLGARSLTPQQSQNLSLLKSDTGGADGTFDQFSQPAGHTSQHQPQLSNPFQAQNQQLGGLSRHARQSSRYTFGNETGSAAAVKPTATTQLMMLQQGNTMAGPQPKGFGSQPQMQSGFNSTYSNVQGPPPGLKSSGTPPISGGGMFGQGHGFTSGTGSLTSFGGSHGLAKSNSEDLFRDAMRARGPSGAADAGKVDLSDPSILQVRTQQMGTGQAGYGSQGQGQQGDHAVPSQPASTSKISEPTGKPAQQGTELVETLVSHMADFPPLSEAGDRRASDTKGGGTIKKKNLKAQKVEAMSQESTAVPSTATETLPTLAKESPKSKDPIKDPVTPSRGESGSNDRATTSAGKVPKLSKLVTEAVQEPKPSTSKGADGASSASKDTALQKDPTFNSSPNHPATPVTATSQSPISAARQPRTLRLVSSSRNEAATSGEAQGGPGPSQPSGNALHERTPSSSQIPGTPVNEQTSEQASVTSNSVSRSASPSQDQKPVAANVQSKSKAQRKKDRPAKIKPLEETKAMYESAKPIGTETQQDDVVQAPIIGRKKKTKKPSKPVTTRPSAETAIGAGDPAEDKTSNTPTDVVADTPKDSEPVDESAEPPSAPVKIADTMEQATAITESSSSSAIIEYLKNKRLIDPKHFDAFLNPTSLHQRFDGAAAPPDALDTWQFTLSRAQRRVLDQNNAVMVLLTDNEYGVILPDGGILRFFHKDEALRYVELHQQILSSNPAFLSYTYLPVCGKMNSTWTGARKTLRTTGPPPSTTSISTEYDQFFKTTTEPEGSNDVTTPPNLAEGGGDHTNVQTADFEEAKKALKLLEEEMDKARKWVEAEEKRFAAVLRRNRKQLKGIA